MTSEILAIVVLLIAMATISLWRQAARRPPKPKKDFIAALLHGKPITPKHQPPRIIGERFSSLVTEEDQLFFGHFVDFATVVNWWLADKQVNSDWRLQELPDTELKLSFSDTPDFGRRYAVFHNQIQLGTLELSAGFDYSVENPNVCANVELEYVRLLTFGNVQSFLTSIALHVSNPDPSAKEHSQTRQDIDRALMQVLWQTQQISEFDMGDEGWGELELQLNGSASWYFTRRQALRKQRVAA